MAADKRRKFDGIWFSYCLRNTSKAEEKVK